MYYQIQGILGQNEGEFTTKEGAVKYFNNWACNQTLEGAKNLMNGIRNEPFNISCEQLLKGWNGFKLLIINNEH